MVKKIGKKELYYMIFIFIILIIITFIRIIIGIIYSVPVLVLEGYHALVDAVISFFIVVTIYLVRSRFAKRFPYGLYRLEDLVAVLLSIIIIIILIDNLKYIHSNPQTINSLAVGVQIISIPFLIIIIILKLKIAEALSSPSMKADAMHAIVDVLESSAVAGGLLLFKLTGIAWTYTGAFIISIIGLGIAAFEAGYESFLALLDLPRDKDLINEIINLLNKNIKNKFEIVDVKARWAGPVVFIDILLRSHPLNTIEFVGRMTNRIKEIIYNNFQDIEDVRITVEPSIRKKLMIAVPLEKKDVRSPVSKHFARSPYLGLFYIENNEFLISNIIELNINKINKSKEIKEFLKGAELAEWLHELGVTDVIVTNIGEIAFSLLLRHKILIWRANPEKNALNNIYELLRGRLEPLWEPTHEASWKKTL